MKIAKGGITSWQHIQHQRAVKCIPSIIDVECDLTIGLRGKIVEIVRRRQVPNQFAATVKNHPRRRERHGQNETDIAQENVIAHRRVLVPIDVQIGQSGWHRLGRNPCKRKQQAPQQPSLRSEHGPNFGQNRRIGNLGKVDLALCRLWTNENVQSNTGLTGH